MKIIDLTLPLFDHMPVYPGDPEVIIQQIHSLKHQGWNLQTTTLTTHIGTHVNAPIHMTESGKTIDELPLEQFFGPTTLYHEGIKTSRSSGLIFAKENVSMKIAEQLVLSPPKFIGISKQSEFDISVEKFLLEHDIISYENLDNTEKLPEHFMFYGFPLKLKEGDGSPVRAIAIID